MKRIDWKAEKHLAPVARMLDQISRWWISVQHPTKPNCRVIKCTLCNMTVIPCISNDYYQEWITIREQQHLRGELHQHQLFLQKLGED